MNLLKFKSFSMLLAMAAALSLTACREEILPGDDGTVSTGTEAGSGKVVYLTAGIALPTSAGTRSGTDKNKPTGEDNDQTNSDIDKGENGLPDYEYGYDYENDVRTMILVIADTKNNYLAHSVIKNVDAEPTTGKPFDFTVNGEIKYEDLEAAYSKGTLKTDQTVRIYVYCNYTGRLLQYFTDNTAEKLREEGAAWIDEAGEVIEAASPAGQSPAISNTIWAPRSFLMTNSKWYEFEFPETIEGWDDYADKNNPYKLVADDDAVDQNKDKTKYESIELTPIRVERAAARLDFKDGSGNNNTYALTIDPAKDIPQDGDDEPAEGELKNLFSIQLTRMSLVNMSKHFYYFRRVATYDEETNEIGTPEIGKAETNTNFVIDTDADYKSKGYLYTEENASGDFYTPSNADGTAGKPDGFNFVLYNKDNSYARDKWYTDNISDVLSNGKKDTWTDHSYNIWRYVTENTIPGKLNQTTVQSTGIVFKGSIIAGEHIKDGFDGNYDAAQGMPTEPYVSAKVKEALAEAAKHTTSKVEDDDNGYDYPVLYSFNNMLYGDIDELITAAALDGHNGALFIAVTNILKNWKKKDLEGGKVTFSLDGDGEELTVDYYYSWLNYENARTRYQEKVEALAEELDEEYNSTDPKPEGWDKAEYIKEEMAKFEAKYAEANPYYDKIEDISWGGSEGNFDDKFMSYAPQNNITIYKASNEEDGEGWGYYCYYFYWNRHNDNGKSGEMGPMEFATVRNNVYKLSVTKIGALGHPRITDYDPDPMKPWYPDEQRLRYIQVQVEVLPWVVRKNDIEF